MMLMIDRRLAEVHPVLSLAGQLVEAWQGNLPQKESLKVFFLVLQGMCEAIFLSISLLN